MNRFTFIYSGNREKNRGNTMNKKFKSHTPGEVVGVLNSSSVFCEAKYRGGGTQ